MFTHIVVGSNDIDRSKKFYDAVFGVLGIEGAQANGRLFYRNEGDLFMVTAPVDGKAACHANGGTIGFAMKDEAQCNAWHDAGVAAGGKSCEDPPGVRTVGPNTMYLAYLRDPDGNKLCGRVVAG